MWSRQLLTLIFFCGILSIFEAVVNAYLSPIGPYKPLSGTPPPVGSIWPRPLRQSLTRNFVQIDTTNFRIILTDCLTLNWARHQYTQLVQNLSSSGSNRSIKNEKALLSTLKIQLQECSQGYPDHKSVSSENYELSIIRQGPTRLPQAILKAKTTWGAIRGLESFYQLLWENGEKFQVNLTKIVDGPRFIHRGLMVDTARHYLPESTVVDILTAMMYNKLNVFHWHIIDDQSFPYVSSKFPELSEKGAFFKEAIYSPATVSRIVEAARNRGIRIIFEFDTPGHSAAFGQGRQDLLTPCYGDGKTPGVPDYPYHAAYENIDPTNVKVYDFMQEFFTEVTQNVSKDPFLHLGLDEVHDFCWRSSPIIERFMEDHGLKSLSQVQFHYAKRLIKMVQSLGVTPIVWQDPLDEKLSLDKNVVVQIWKNDDKHPWRDAWKSALNKGYKVILSACWYNNAGDDWEDYYNCDPIRGAGIPEEQEAQILGGEAAIWGEYVDRTNIIPRLFPVTGTVAEVLWDDRKDKRDSVDNVRWRLDQFRCSLLRRKIPAQPIWLGFCGKYEL